MTTAVQQQKARLRERLMAARAALSPQTRAALSRQIALRLTALPELPPERAVFGYVATPAEVDVGAWLRWHLAGGGRLYLPRVHGADLQIFAVDDLDADLETGWRGLKEPRADRGHKPVDPRLIEAAVVPGVAFDATGGRLGQGGGHMDRLLARLLPGTPIVGVAFSLQFLAPPADLVPMEEHDVRVHVVVTEQLVHRPC